MKLKFPPFMSAASKTGSERTPEEQDILKSLKEVRESIENVYERLNFSSDELITDSLNYELLALNSRHRFYLQKARELNLKSVYMEAEI